MPIDEPVTLSTGLLILFYSLYCFISLLRKVRSVTPPIFFFANSFLMLFLMTICSTLYHMNNSLFLPFHIFGTMVFGGLLSTSLALAAIFDNFKSKKAYILAGFPVAAFFIYLFSIQLKSFAPFIFLQFLNIALILFAYFKKLPSEKAILIYSACAAFIIAGFIQLQAFQVWIFNHNDIFHFVSLLSMFLLYKAVIAENSARS